MHWKLDINKQYENTTIKIKAPELTANISRLTTFIDQLSNTIVVKKEDEQIEIEIQSIIYIENVEQMPFIY